MRQRARALLISRRAACTSPSSPARPTLLAILGCAFQAQTPDDETVLHCWGVGRRVPRLPARWLGIPGPAAAKSEHASAGRERSARSGADPEQGTQGRRRARRPGDEGRGCVPAADTEVLAGKRALHLGQRDAVACCVQAAPRLSARRARTAAGAGAARAGAPPHAAKAK